MLLKDADGIAENVYPDQTAPLVWSVSALFVQTYLSENLGSLRYVIIISYFSDYVIIMLHECMVSW